MRAEVRRWAAKIGVNPVEVHVRPMRMKWASCSTAGRVSFNRDLLRERPSFRRVVIVHELLHLLVPNHGKLFKTLLSAYVPDWERAAHGKMSHLCGPARRR